jgi:predicted enzyme related to lactoylglutathione lyase
VTGLVTHYEIYGEDAARRAQFYLGQFRWKLEKAPADLIGVGLSSL